MFDTVDHAVATDPAEATEPDPGTGPAAAAVTDPADAVAGLDADQTLSRLARQRRDRERLEFDQLALAAHWADLHGHLDRPDGAAVLPGAERLIGLGGDGTPAVAEFCPAELAAVLGMSPYAGAQLIADALDLRHRLPVLWTRIGAGQVQPWIGRRVAQNTRQLSVQACAVVDAKVAGWCSRLTWTRLAPVIAAAVLQADPDQAGIDAGVAKHAHGVWVDLNTAGTGTGSCFIRADSTELARFDAALNRVATDLASLGDDRSRDQRRASAVGVLANPHEALDLHADASSDAVDGTTTTVAHSSDTTESSRRSRPSSPRRGGRGGGPGSAELVLYVHLTDQALRRTASTDASRNRAASAGDNAAEGAGEGAVARVEGIGPVLATTVRDWLTPGPGRRANTITVKPVLDLADQTPVDAYEIPDQTREALHLRTPADCFPHATNTNRTLDHDHTDPYQPIPDGGPPGQTRPDNLGKLTRYHHRIKTHSRWHVKQPFPGHYLWRSPHGRLYLVDHTGTRQLN